MYSPGASTLRVGIYFPGRHVLLFGMIKTKNPGPSINSPGASTLLVGIYFPGSHVLFFGMIKKKFQAPACTLRVLLLSG